MPTKILIDPVDHNGLVSLMDKYGAGHDMLRGTNESHENVLTSIFPDKIVITTLQKNGWVRKTMYYRDGNSEEIYEGRWIEGTL